MKKFEAVIGLEVHVQLKTKTKMFCPCPQTGTESPPNTAICPICTGQPGALPVINKTAVWLGVKAASCLNLNINKVSVFARKNYFYPDLPKGYQITQYDKPLAEKGYLEIETEKGKKRIRIKRAHLEEDAGKLLHAIGNRKLDYTLIDFNRAGVPLLEIVSEPDISSPEEAYNFLTALKKIMQWADISNCDMEKGEFRSDVNISVRKRKGEEPGTKVEIKNLNSFKAVKDALSYELRRQSDLLEKSEKINMDTRLWNEKENKTVSMRAKEMAYDYRYLPEPDLPPLFIDEETLASAKFSGELPFQKKEKFINDYGLSEYDADVLTSSKDLSDYFELCISANEDLVPNAAAKDRLKTNAKTLANLIISELLAKVNESGEKSVAPGNLIPPRELAAIAGYVTGGTISPTAGKKLFSKVCETGGKAGDLLKEMELAQVSDEGRITKWVIESITENPKAAEDFRKGNKKALGPIMASLMRKSGNSANPRLAAKILKKILEKGV